jgi:transcriptional regulator with XRE-family HTH domain
MLVRMKHGSDINQRLGYRLRLLRENAGLTQQQLADLVAPMHRSYLSRIEDGSVDVPLWRLERLAKALGVKVNQILGEEPIAETALSAGIRMLDDMVAQIHGVKVRRLGTVPIEARRWKPQGKDGDVIEVLYGWTGGRDPSTLFVVEAADDSLLEHDIPQGHLVLVHAYDGTEPRPGDRVLVQAGDMIRLVVWPTLIGFAARGSQVHHVGDVFVILGIVLATWAKLKD